MKSMQQYKDAVMHRVEEKKAAQKRTTRRILAVCLPLCVCIGLLGLSAVPQLLIGEDAIAPESSGTADGSTASVSATVLREGTLYPVEDADALYEAVLLLFETVGGENGRSDAVPEYGNSESYYESAPQADASSCYLTFHRSDITHRFILKDGVLTDLTTGQSIAVTTAQEEALQNGDVPSDGYFYCDDYFVANAPSAPDSIQWFPFREGFERDDLWEVLTDSGYCQGFWYTVEDTGNAALLDLVFADDGSLTLTRNKVSGTSAPYIQTFLFESGPFFDLQSGNVLHIDFEATSGWSIELTFCHSQTRYNNYTVPNRSVDSEAYTVKLDDAILQACNVPSISGVGTAERFTATLDLYATLQALSAQGDEAATAVLALDKVEMPQLRIYCIGEAGDSLTMHKWLYSPLNDPNGEECWFACIDLATGGYVENNGLPASKRIKVWNTTTTTALPTATASTAPQPAATPQMPFPVWWLAFGGITVAVVIGVIVWRRS